MGRCATWDWCGRQAADRRGSQQRQASGTSPAAPRAVEVDHVRDGADDREGEDRRRRIQPAELRHVEITGQPDSGLRHGHGGGHDDPPAHRAHGRLGVGDHEEDEQLVHRAGDRRDFCEQRAADDPMAQRRERDEARHIGERDVEHADSSHDEEPETPDHRVRGQVVAPLAAQDGDARRRRQHEQGDGKVARVPEVPATVLQHVLRGDREEAAQRERPEQIDAGLDQEREADAGDVGALWVREAPPHPARQSQLRRHANPEADGEPIVAAEDAIARLAQHQDQRDEERDQVAGIQLAQPGPQRPASLSDGRRSDRGHASGRGSVTTWSWSTAGCSIVWTVPDGHRIMTRSARPVRPSPKCSRRSFWLANPTPPCTICSWRSVPNSTVTSAPVALRFDRVPTSLNAIQWLPGATVFLYTSAGCFWFATTTSSTPRLNRSTSTTARPSYSSVTPT